MDEFEYLTIDFDDGESAECEILGTFECEGQEYIALLPAEESADEVGDVYLFKYDVLDDKSFTITDIDDDDLFEKVSREFYKMSQEFLL